MHPECWPIPVPRNDPYFPALNISSGRPHCIAFTRSLPGQQRLGPREQLNQNTAFVDASQIYGQVDCTGSFSKVVLSQGAVKQVFLGVFLMFLAFFYSKIWAQFHFGTFKPYK